MPVATSQEFPSSHPLLCTADLDEARHTKTGKFCDQKLLISSRHDRLEVHHHVSDAHVSVNDLHYGADVQIDPSMLRDAYLLQVPLSGGAFVRHRGLDTIVSKNAAALLNPDQGTQTQTQWLVDCRKLLLQIGKTYVHDGAQDLSGAPLSGAVRFDSLVDLTKGPGRMIKDMNVRTALLAEGTGLFSGRNQMHDLWMDNALVSALLTHQSSNIFHLLSRTDHGALSSGIRRALDYIHDNLPELIRLTDFATRAIMNVRWRPKGGRRAYGQSLMHVLRDARLDAARSHLPARRDRRPPVRSRPSVTNVAYANGFSHLGRFSRDYKDRFGCLPSRIH